MTNQPSTLAPSEKHMEDWIVQNPGGFGSPNLSPINGLIARQSRCQDGIIDLIAYKDHRLQVIELKKGEIDSDALAQILRYMKDVRSVFDSVGVNLFIQQKTSRCYGFAYEGAQFVQGILVGHSIEKSVYLACYEAGVQVLLYSFENGVYAFDTAKLNGLYDEDQSPGLQQLRPMFEQFILHYDHERTDGGGQ